ncbi:MAG: hypothetical protein K2F71_03210 [Paramuribaculum sp.]|nr:hypothetical protein [Paramuribaculum sp.]
MRIFVSFSEISEYVGGCYGKQVVFSKVSEREVRAAYVQNVIITKVEVPVYVQIDRVASDFVTVSYKSGHGVDMIIAGMLTFLKARLPELEAVVAEDSRRVRIDLGKLPQTASLLEHVNLRNIVVKDDGFEVTASLKA